MRIAIIGAGLSGLSCAHELERCGISPDIFEDLDFIGDREPHITANLAIADRPIGDLISYYDTICHLIIKPVNVIKKLTHFSPNMKTVIQGGTFGYFFKRGKEADSLKRQIHSQLTNSTVFFGQKPDFRDLSRQYDFVVVANALPGIPKELDCWTGLITGWIKGAVVLGDFDPDTTVW